MENKNNTLSIAALVLGIVGIVFDFIYTIAGLIIGIVGIGVMYACAICAVGAFLSLAQI